MSDSKTVTVLLNDATGRLVLAGIDTPGLDARLLLQSVLGISHAEIIADGSRVASPEEIESLSELLTRRLGREPVHRILGRKEFWGLELEISPDVLDPRSDTEVLVETALEWVDYSRNRTDRLRIADIGTGSGAIILALLTELKSASAVAIDISDAALAQAGRNADKLGLSNRIEFLRGSWCSPLTGKFDLIVSNPPYIKTSTIGELEQEVRGHDPEIALDGGVDGLEAYRQLFSQSEKFLNSRGAVIYEIGHDQADKVTTLAQKNRWTNIKIMQDITGNDRVLSASP